MNHQDFTKTIQNQISLLPRQRLLDLALKISKELFFGYHTFSQKWEWGNSDFLLDGIILCDKTFNGETDLTNIRELMSQINSVTPQMDDCNNLEIAFFAFNAAVSVYESLEFLMDNDKIHIINIATYYTEAIEFKVQYADDVTLEDIDNHPLIVHARQFLLDESK